MSRTRIVLALAAALFGVLLFGGIAYAHGGGEAFTGVPCPHGSAITEQQYGKTHGCKPSPSPKPSSPSASPSTSASTSTAGSPHTSKPAASLTAAVPVGNRLPVTGPPVGVLVATGALLVLVGAAVLWRTRRRTIVIPGPES